MSNSTESPPNHNISVSVPSRFALYFLSRGSFIVIAVLIGLNFVPRLTNPRIGEKWFVMPVPSPVRFYYYTRLDHPPNSQWIFGFPFRYYLEDGWQFTTKDQSTLFLSRTPQRPIWERLSIMAFVVNVAVTVALVFAIRFVVKSLMLKIAPQQLHVA